MATKAQPEVRSSILGRLGAPRLEMRIAPGDARAYGVKAGEYVQIVDVEGKECSDFLAFNGSDYADEMNLTLTRTNCEGLWPAPGQYVYAGSGIALLRMEEDLVGRHDTTLPACNAAYYAAMGYPDHKNCTDSFNRALAAFGLGVRNPWEPINFFFNTRLAEDQRTLVIEEPLSRPGDYVLMRAETDLLLATSACPDDLSPTNGWNPTEILVRVYPPLTEE
jgi:aminomethyltransferase